MQGEGDLGERLIRDRAFFCFCFFLLLLYRPVLVMTLKKTLKKVNDDLTH